MTNLLERAISTDDGARAAKIIQDALGIVSVVKTFGTFSGEIERRIWPLLSDVKRPGRDGEDVDSEWSVV